MDESRWLGRVREWGIDEDDLGDLVRDCGGGYVADCGFEEKLSWLRDHLGQKQAEVRLKKLVGDPGRGSESLRPFLVVAALYGFFVVTVALGTYLGLWVYDRFHP